MNTPVRVRLETPRGSLLMELMVAQAPLTCAAFLRCIDEGGYRQVAFCRAVRADNDNGSPPIEVVQAAAMDLSPAVAGVLHESTADTGLRHLDGTVSIGRAAVGTADPRAIFICIGDQPGLGDTIEAEARLGSRFSIHVFHEQLLSTGPVALADLERHVRTWVEHVANEYSFFSVA